VPAPHGGARVPGRRGDTRSVTTLTTGARGDVIGVIYDAGMQTALEQAQSRTHALENMFLAAHLLRESNIPAASPESVSLLRELLPLSGEQAMRQHLRARGVTLREAAGTPTGKRTYTPAVRKLLATEGKARPDGSYPIRDAQDVSDAVDDFDRSEGSDADREHIILRAKAVPGGTDALPASWSGSTRLQESMTPGWSIPTLDGGTLGAVRLREAKSAADLSRLGVPILADSPLAGQRPSELPPGIPTLAPGTGGLSRTRLTESVGGSVLRRVS
jgi:hypothetical protein